MAESFVDKLYKNGIKNSDAMHSPDVLSCLANLSNDEVFTPPEVVNRMLDMLPQELFSDPNTKFLDPATKTGVFLREIAKRLLIGLEDKIPDLQERIDHIFHNQLYGIAITELTSLLSRRSVYCTQYPNGQYSISKFDSSEGNIRFKKIQHTWEGEKCKYCGASRSLYGRTLEKDSHAYEFIHTLEPEKILNMKFDVIIGNPPYQLSFGIEGANSSNADSIYNDFIDQAIKLEPTFLTMITPSRWMTKTAQGIPESWVENKINSNKFRVIHDYENVQDCFPGISLTGGVNYFLWEKSYNGECDYYYYKDKNPTPLHRKGFLNSKGAGIVIRNPESYSIIDKIERIHGKYYLDSDYNFSGLVSPKHFFDNGSLLTSNWKGYQQKKDRQYCVKYHVNIDKKRTIQWIRKDHITKNEKTVHIYKVCIPAANGSMELVLGKPFVADNNSVCSQTFLVIGYDPEKHNYSKEQCENIVRYIGTKFFRYLVSIKKKTQNGPRGVYQFVPLQDFNREWTDEELYKKYKLSKEEIDCIEKSIKPFDMEDENGN